MPEIALKVFLSSDFCEEYANRGKDLYQTINDMVNDCIEAGLPKVIKNNRKEKKIKHGKQI